MITEIRIAKRNPWINARVFDQCNIKIGAELDKIGNPVTGLTREEEKDFEALLDYPDGTLSKNSKFWHEFNVMLDKSTLILDDDIPEHRLWLKFLKAQKKVAKSPTDLRTNADAKFVLYSEEDEAKNEVSSVSHKVKAYGTFAQMTPAEKRETLTLYGKKTDNLSDVVVEGHLSRLLEENPSKFSVIFNDPKKKDKLFLTELISYGILERRGPAYVYGEDQIGFDQDSAIAFMEDKDNNQLKATLKKLLAEKKKV